MNKYALITGASGGIGRAVAYALAEKGFNLYVHYNSNKNSVDTLITELAGKFEGEYYPIQADLGEAGGYKAIVPHIFSLDVIIHCGGIAVSGLFQDLTDDEAGMLFNVHVLNPILLTKALLPKLLAKKDGSIVFISSIWGQTGAACEAAYSAAKGAQISFVKALGKELALSGIRVNAVAPGAVETAMLNQFTSSELDRIADDIPMGRLGRAEEVANGVVFLVSDQATYITGQILSINGGWYT
ncbi:elongation factor P 5-aminopentanone reductase [Bacillus sp. B-jedd]|uniref:elongation factor P 5-aminopentanone reductase n=1 Tax=Bacillus sp. B-jedd TaxID=1476857 RepID=UPI0005156238|nr:SDR family oxidoreductase [Bacillus sp. B-jedd]CEG26861.1 short-chain dehydrogenase/reductase SDR [Bacillus sp. B-jedd]